MKLVIVMAIENDALDGPAIMRAMPAALTAVQSTLSSGELIGYEVKPIIAPAGVPEPVQVTIRSHWEKPRPMAEPDVDADAAILERVTEEATP